MKISVSPFVAGFLVLLLSIPELTGQTAMTNLSARNSLSLNGNWQVIVDPSATGHWREVWKEKKPEKKTDFFEYGFDGGPVLKVPGDFNTQMPELTYYEGAVWYKKSFNITPTLTKRYFLHFGAVNYFAEVYLNGELLGTHEGGFTPFQFEITKKVKAGENRLIVYANNQRKPDGLPAIGFDWFNYGGITRDVSLISTNKTYIDDYLIQFKKNSGNEVDGWIQLNGRQLKQNIQIEIPELKLSYKTKTDSTGFAKLQFKGKFILWNPENPKLYRVIIRSETDTLTEEIGFRNIEIQGSQVVLNGKPVFFKSVNIHEENPIRAAKAYSEADAELMLGWAKELGCNMVRLAHYPHNEYMVKMAEKMGLMVWSELPVYQHIAFSTPGVEGKIETMMREMIKRDRNRCAVVIWSISNETYPGTPERDNVLQRMAQTCKQLDATRLNTTVICNQGYSENVVDVWDTLYRHFDIVSVNEYLGWYVPWQGNPQDTKWKLVCPDKPVFISEFGGEAVFGNHSGPADEAAWWNEEYQEQIYKDQISMFSNIPNLVGVSPWILVDFRSLSRLHPVYQKGWNRKGLLSDKGEKKKAWYVMNEFNKSIPGY